MTYEELLDKWLRKLGRPCTAGEIVQDLRHLERPRNLYYEQLQKESDGELVAVVRCKDCKWYEIAHLKRDGTDDKRYKSSVCVRGTFAKLRKADWYCADGERREDETN